MCEMKNTLDKINSGLSNVEEILMDIYIEREQQKLSGRNRERKG